MKMFGKAKLPQFLNTNRIISNYKSQTTQNTPHTMHEPDLPQGISFNKKLSTEPELPNSSTVANIWIQCASSNICWKESKNYSRTEMKPLTFGDVCGKLSI